MSAALGNYRDIITINRNARLFDSDRQTALYAKLAAVWKHNLVKAIALRIGFESLDAPVVRVGAIDTPVPFAGVLEKAFLPKAEFEEKLITLLGY